MEPPTQKRKDFAHKLNLSSYLSPSGNVRCILIEMTAVNLSFLQLLMQSYDFIVTKDLLASVRRVVSKCNPKGNQSQLSAEAQQQCHIFIFAAPNRLRHLCFRLTQELHLFAHSKYSEVAWPKHQRTASIFWSCMQNQQPRWKLKIFS